MSKYLIFSNDVVFGEKISKLTGNKETIIAPTEKFPFLVENCQLVIVDIDSIATDKIIYSLSKFRKARVPVMAGFSEIESRSVVRLLNAGVVSFFFKEDSIADIRKSIRKVVYEFHYYEKIKEIIGLDEKLRLFLQTLNNLTSDMNIDEVIYQILKAMQSVFDLKKAAFYLSSENKLKSKISIGTTVEDNPLPEISLNAPKPAWLTNILKNRLPYFIKNPAGKAAKVITGNTYMLPLFFKDKLIGLIAATFRTTGLKNKMTKNEMMLMKAFCDQASVAIENARLYCDVLQTRETLISKEKKALLGQMIISLNHEIKNPLSIISMEAQLLQKNIPATQNIKIDDRLSKIEHNIERIKNILEKISAINIDDHIAVEYLSGRQMLNLAQ